jgi:hypothetical protein
MQVPEEIVKHKTMNNMWQRRIDVFSASHKLRVESRGVEAGNQDPVTKLRPRKVQAEVQEQPEALPVVFHTLLARLATAPHPLRFETEAEKRPATTDAPLKTPPIKRVVIAPFSRRTPFHVDGEFKKHHTELKKHLVSSTNEVSQTHPSHGSLTSNATQQDSEDASRSGRRGSNSSVNFIRQRPTRELPLLAKKKNVQLMQTQHTPGESENEKNQNEQTRRVTGLLCDIDRGYDLYKRDHPTYDMPRSHTVTILRPAGSQRHPLVPDMVTLHNHNKSTMTYRKRIQSPYHQVQLLFRIIQKRAEALRATFKSHSAHRRKSTAPALLMQSVVNQHLAAHHLHPGPSSHNKRPRNLLSKLALISIPSTRLRKSTSQSLARRDSGRSSKGSLNELVPLRRALSECDLSLNNAWHQCHRHLKQLRNNILRALPLAPAVVDNALGLLPERWHRPHEQAPKTWVDQVIPSRLPLHWTKAQQLKFLKRYETPLSAPTKKPNKAKKGGGGHVVSAGMFSYKPVIHKITGSQLLQIRKKADAAVGIDPLHAQDDTARYESLEAEQDDASDWDGWYDLDTHTRNSPSDLSSDTKSVSTPSTPKQPPANSKKSIGPTLPQPPLPSHISPRVKSTWTRSEVAALRTRQRAHVSQVSSQRNAREHQRHLLNLRHQREIDVLHRRHHGSIVASAGLDTKRNRSWSDTRVEELHKLTKHTHGLLGSFQYVYWLDGRQQDVVYLSEDNGQQHRAKKNTGEVKAATRMSSKCT